MNSVDRTIGGLALTALVVFLVHELCAKQTPPLKLLAQVLVLALTIIGGTWATAMLANEAWNAYIKTTPGYDPSARHMAGLAWGLCIGFVTSTGMGIWAARKINFESTDESAHSKRPRP
jgi:uncharacterized membrane protein YidH (DUF202 family)